MRPRALSSVQGCRAPSCGLELLSEELAAGSFWAGGPPGDWVQEPYPGDAVKFTFCWCLILRLFWPYVFFYHPTAELFILLAMVYFYVNFILPIIASS